MERVLFRSTNLIRRDVLKNLKTLSKVVTYCLTIIYSCALVCVALPTVVSASFIGAIGTVAAGAGIGSIFGKLLCKHLIERGFKEIDRVIVEIQNMMCKNLNFYKLMLEGGNVEEIKKALEYGPNVNMDINGSTPLMIAIERKMDSVIERLKDLGADINKTNMDPVIERLIELELGADINKTNMDSVIERLIELGADINKTDFEGLLRYNPAVISKECFYKVVKQHMNKKVRDLDFAINKFERSEEGFSENVIGRKLDKFKQILDTIKIKVEANNFDKDVWNEYNYDLNQRIMRFYMRSRNKFANELQNQGAATNELQNQGVATEELHNNKIQSVANNEIERVGLTGGRTLQK